MLYAEMTLKNNHFYNCYQIRISCFCNGAIIILGKGYSFVIICYDSSTARERLQYTAWICRKSKPSIGNNNNNGYF